MKKITLYHNCGCSKSLASLKLLEKSGVETRLIHYLETPPTEAELDQLLKLLGLEPEQIVRRNEDRYSELELDINPPSSRSSWIRLLTENPILIERPIATDGEKAVIGRPPENVLSLLGQEWASGEDGS